MPEFDSLNTTDPSAPTTEQMDAMWRDLREQEAAQERADLERRRRIVMAFYGEAA